MKNTRAFICKLKFVVVKFSMVADDIFTYDFNTHDTYISIAPDKRTIPQVIHIFFLFLYESICCGY